MRDNSAANFQTNGIFTGNTLLHQEKALDGMEPVTRELVKKIYQTQMKYEQIGELLTALNS